MKSGTECGCKYYGICWTFCLVQFIWLIWPFLVSLQCSILIVEMYGQKVWCWSITAEDWNDDVAREQPPDLDYFAPIVISSSSLVLLGRAEILTVVINLFLFNKIYTFFGKSCDAIYRVLFILPQRKMQEICNFLHIKSSSVLAQCLQLWHYYAQT